MLAPSVMTYCLCCMSLNNMDAHKKIELMEEVLPTGFPRCAAGLISVPKGPRY